MTANEPQGSTSSSWRAAGLRRFVTAGLIAGGGVALLNLFIYLALIGGGGHAVDGLTAVSVILASFIPNLLAALLLFVLTRLTRLARPLFTIVVVALVLVSVLPHLGIGPAPSPALAALPEGFDLMTIPLHLTGGLSAILLMPWLVRRRRGAGPVHRG